MAPLIEKLYASGRSIHSFGQPAARGIHRLRYTGLSIEQADRWAVRCGYHPVEVWDDWYDLPLPDLPDVALPPVPRPSSGPSLEEAITRALAARMRHKVKDGLAGRDDGSAGETAPINWYRQCL